MATTYDLSFDFRLALFKLTARKKYNDSIRSDASYLIDLAQKLGALSMGNTTGLGDAVAGGASMAHVAEYDIPASGTATIDLQSLTLVDERTAQALGRYKFLFFWLLPTAKGGTAASMVTVGNAGSGAHQLFLGADAHTFRLRNDDWLANKVGAAAGEVVDGTNHNVLLTNNDAGLVAKLLVAVVGGA